MTDYYTKATLGMDFEDRGLLVTGSSRVGKTREMKQMLSDFNKEQIRMPDGRPARFVHCILSGKVTWKDLGSKTLEALGYPIEVPRTQAYLWKRVADQVRLQGVVGILYDECQHVFTKDGDKTNRIFLDSFKALLKDSRWPLMLVLAGVPELGNYIAQYEQLAYLLRPVHFDLIDLPKDIEEMNRLAYTYADRAGLNFDPLSTVDFFERLAFSCAMRWGLVIELLIEAFTNCELAGATTCSIEQFEAAFAKFYGTPAGFSPFTAPDYRESFDQQTLLELLKRTR